MREKMPQIYNEEFRKNIVRLHHQEGRTYKRLIDEFGVTPSKILSTFFTITFVLILSMII